MAEKALWRLLYVYRTDGYHFRKQSPIGPYFVDFVCKHAGLIIEVDGDTHGSDEQARQDARRSAFLNSQGYDVIRFSNADVLTNPEGVGIAVASALAGRVKNQRSVPARTSPSPALPPKGEGDPTAAAGGYETE